MGLRAALEHEGLRGAPADGLSSRLEVVDRLLDLIPDLAQIVSAVVGAIHPLQAPPSYDVSHSQPKWRDRVFVSFPERRDEIGDLRLTESVIHEAMHLHLTNEESRTPFVAAEIDTFYSPWMHEDRPARGVLHGLFVFSCISAFLVRVRKSSALGLEADRHIDDRIVDITTDISGANLPALDRALTPHARAQVRLWMTTLPVATERSGATCSRHQ